MFSYSTGEGGTHIYTQIALVALRSFGTCTYSTRVGPVEAADIRIYIRSGRLRRIERADLWEDRYVNHTATSYQGSDKINSLVWGAHQTNTGTETSA
jgi:hypothetical protein